MESKLKDLRDKGCISQNTYNAIASYIRGIKVGVKENFKLAEEHLNNIYKLGLKLILIDLRKICKKEKVETSILKEEIEKQVKPQTQQKKQRVFSQNSIRNSRVIKCSLNIENNSNNRFFDLK
jgi:ribosomal protein L19E